MKAARCGSGLPSIDGQRRSGEGAALAHEASSSRVPPAWPGCCPGRCGMMSMQATMNAAITTEARSRLKASPPAWTGLSRRSPTVAPNGRVRTNAAQNKKTREMLVEY